MVFCKHHKNNRNLRYRYDLMNYFRHRHSKFEFRSAKVQILLLHLIFTPNKLYKRFRRLFECQKDNVFFCFFKKNWWYNITRGEIHQTFLMLYSKDLVTQINEQLKFYEKFMVIFFSLPMQGILLLSCLATNDKLKYLNVVVTLNPHFAFCVSWLEISNKRVFLLCLTVWLRCPWESK